MRVIEGSMEQGQDERARETGDRRENPPANGIVRHNSHMRICENATVQQKDGERRAEEMADPREKPPTSDIVRHDSHMRKSRSDSAGDGVRLNLVGGEQANRSATTTLSDEEED
ncbi:hypothetical protein PR048_015741 [Dryococelus australis]|uniref:Uncharacterized protein n=1 Tax=Dryococelus australis TaxID=614101 RepID=A0ABQ9HHS8_9NEOP|nr:hypothetical protein PR048_015741 [Dryococelus australis]